MYKKQIITGFLVGLFFSIIGTILFTLFVGFKLGLDLNETLSQGFSTKLLSKRASMGALLNLPVFYYFINKKKDRIAQGILMSVLIVALIFIITM